MASEVRKISQTRLIVEERPFKLPALREPRKAPEMRPGFSP